MLSPGLNFIWWTLCFSDPNWKPPGNFIYNIKNSKNGEFLEMISMRCKAKNEDLRKSHVRKKREVRVDFRKANHLQGGDAQNPEREPRSHAGLF
jgi:hypothetical protein